MALLAKKLSFLPIFVSRAPGCHFESYILARSFATRRTTNKAPAVVINDAENETSTDEDDVMSDSMEVVSEFDNVPQNIDGTSDVFDIPCRVATPTLRRCWASTQDESALRFRMDMPGIAKEDVKVYVDNTKLVVMGKYSGKKIFAELENDEANAILDNEGFYSAELHLPENVQVDKIKSQMKDGMLLVTAPKNVTKVLVE